MTVRSTFRFLVLALIAGSLIHAGEMETDPHQLYAQAKGQMRKGDLAEASASLAKLRSLISRNPKWDPDGAFAKELIPSFSTRLERLQKVAADLDDFSDRALQDLQLPRPAKDFPTIDQYTQWATTTIQKLRGERDGIVEAGLKDSEDRACITQTASYARTEQLLQTDLLKKASDASGSEVLGVLSGDAETETVLVRFRQLKVELLKVMAERDALSGNLRKSREDESALQRALAVIVAEDGNGKVIGRDARTAEVGESFARFLERRIEAAFERGSQTTVERDAWLADVERYRRINRALVDAGIGKDQKIRLATLEKSIEKTPVHKGPGRPTPLLGALGNLLLALLVMIAALTCWLAFVRGRALKAMRLVSARGGARPTGAPEATERHHDAA
ncbi:MAG TPA: hypothetical protein VFW45_04375 [Candidatus Polarisedimenticolia bacterium]|nr:hypothetical protein [Candidatus Polarisedimenticolia bacterium]